MDHEQELIYRVINYAKGRGDFVKQHLFNDLQLSPEDINYLEKFAFAHDHSNLLPNTLFLRTNTTNATGHMQYIFRVVPTALFHYNDYLELKAARKASNEARLYAIAAIIISILAIIVQVITQ
jgi:hypothetical protein